jgi:hypothetical protein
VTYSFPAIRSAGRLPFAISLRKPLTPIDPSGNASSAAISNRNGVVGVIVSGDGMTALRINKNSRSCKLPNSKEPRPRAAS